MFENLSFFWAFRKMQIFVKWFLRHFIVSRIWNNNLFQLFRNGGNGFYIFVKQWISSNEIEPLLNKNALEWISNTNCLIASDYLEMISIFNQIEIHISPVTYFAGVIFPEEVHDWPVSTVVNRG